MIPKIIHYCWFGGAPLPDKDKICVESWKKYCPDYEIKRWDETNYNVHKNQYMSQAYKACKWGFVPDYARLDIVFENGGIYLDTDVELTAELDELLENQAYMGFEDGRLVNPGLGFGAEKGNPVIQEMMCCIYGERKFLNADGGFDTTPSPVMNTEFLETKGLVRNNQKQRLNGITIYPKEYFCPVDFQTGVFNPTADMHSIHHFHSSWLTPEESCALLRAQKLRKKYGRDKGTAIARIVNFPYRLRRQIRQKGFIGTIQFAASKCRSRRK